MTAFADHGRHFSGQFELNEVTDLGEEVRCQFAVKIFNHSGADVNGATVVLADMLLPDHVYHSFTSVIFAKDGGVDLETTVTVPSREYETWSQLGQAHMRVEYTEANGDKHIEGVELIGFSNGGGN